MTLETKPRKRNNVALERFRCILPFIVKLKYREKVLVYIATEKVMKIIEYFQQTNFLFFKTVSLAAITQS